MALDRAQSNWNSAEIDRIELEPFHVIWKVVNNVRQKHFLDELLNVQVEERPHLFKAFVEELDPLLIGKQHPVRQIAAQNASNVLRKTAELAS